MWFVFYLQANSSDLKKISEESQLVASLRLILYNKLRVIIVI